MIGYSPTIGARYSISRASAMFGYAVVFAGQAAPGLSDRAKGLPKTSGYLR